jgi:HrpA-like RNA helicase
MRESRFTQVARLAYHIAQQTLPTYSHPKSRHDYTFPQRVACVILKIYLNYTYREMEEWLLATDQVRHALELTRVPDHTTLARTFAKLSQAQWEQLNDALLAHLQARITTAAPFLTLIRVLL